MNSGGMVMYGGAPWPFDDTPRDWGQPTFVPAPRVDSPPTYADDAEQAAIAAVVALDDAARARVLRYLASRFGAP